MYRQELEKPGLGLVRPGLGLVEVATWGGHPIVANTCRQDLPALALGPAAVLFVHDGTLTGQWSLLTA